MKFRQVLLISAAILGVGALVAQAQQPGINSNLQTVWTLVYDASTIKQTFSATAAFSPVASSATDVCILNGSATKTIKVRRVIFAANATTAISVPVAIIKRSTANTGGVTNTMTPARYDSTNAAATATAVVYVGTNPTTGTLAGLIDDSYFVIGNLTTGGTVPVTREYGRLGSPIVLRGVAQGVAVNLQAASESGIVGSCTFEWTEE